jgi:hypothetical protein
VSAGFFNEDAVAAVGAAPHDPVYLENISASGDNPITIPFGIGIAFEVFEVGLCFLLKSMIVSITMVLVPAPVSASLQ